MGIDSGMAAVGAQGRCVEVVGIRALPCAPTHGGVTVGGGEVRGRVGEGRVQALHPY